MGFKFLKFKNRKYFEFSLLDLLNKYVLGSVLGNGFCPGDTGVSVTCVT